MQTLRRSFRFRLSSIQEIHTPLHRRIRPSCNEVCRARHQFIRVNDSDLYSDAHLRTSLCCIDCFEEVDTSRRKMRLHYWTLLFYAQL